jgi:two-component sensor histidine kinase
MLFTPEDRAAGEPQKELQEAARIGRSADERWHLRKDGNRFWASGVLTSIVDDQGRLQGFAKVMRDETERRRSEEELRASLHEKEVLLQEIHHRVKNNLQVITSLLRLQSEHIPDEQTLVLFEEARNRVQAIGGIHELLYQSPDLASVDFQLYLSRLTNDLLTFYGFENHRLRLSLHVANAKLDIGQAVPCGLIVNELVTNALKHAFPPGRSGTLSVSLDCSDGVCSLAVADDGVGLPEGFDWTAGHSLGLQLVRVLTTQLNGAARLERLHPGTSFQISFPMATGEPAIQGLPPQVYPARRT